MPPPRRDRPRPPHDRPRPSNPDSKTPTDWSGVADWYDTLVGKEGSEYQQHVVHPGTLKLLGDVAGKAVLDVACGQGVLCRLLHAKGAATVVGVDASGPLLAAARQHGPEAIRYERLDARELPEAPRIAAEGFDLASCVLAMQNIDRPQPIFAGVARALKAGGRLVVVMTHPAFRGAKASRWGWDEAEGVQYRRVDRYLLPRKAPIVAHPGRDDPTYTWTFHRPIGEYVRYAARAGLLVDALQEWPSHKVSEPGPRGHAENVARKEIPLFLALRCVKVGNLASDEKDSPQRHDDTT